MFDKIKTIFGQNNKPENTYPIARTLIKREEKIDFRQPITIDNVANEIQRQINNEDYPMDLRVTLIHDLHIVNRVRSRGKTDTVDQVELDDVACNLANTIVGNKADFHTIPEEARRNSLELEWSALHDRVCVALGHKATIKRLEQAEI